MFLAGFGCTAETVLFQNHYETSSDATEYRFHPAAVIIVFDLFS
jgi:hypothetical protein